MWTGIVVFVPSDKAGNDNDKYLARRASGSELFYTMMAGSGGNHTQGMWSYGHARAL